MCKKVTTNPPVCRHRFLVRHPSQLRFFALTVFRWSSACCIRLVHELLCGTFNNADVMLAQVDQWGGEGGAGGYCWPTSLLSSQVTSLLIRSDQITGGTTLLTLGMRRKFATPHSTDLNIPTYQLTNSVLISSGRNELWVLLRTRYHVWWWSISKGTVPKTLKETSHCVFPTLQSLTHFYQYSARIQITRRPETIQILHVAKGVVNKTQKRLIVSLVTN